MLRTPPPSWATWQSIINAKPVPSAGVVEAITPVPVVARIVWGIDGEELVNGDAIRWTHDLVLVELRDQRSATVGPWLDAGDVRRAPIPWTSQPAEQSPPTSRRSTRR